jgi:all-trans-8'-apo-beta-carotenal 15,15'-oxygenase
MIAFLLPWLASLAASSSSALSSVGPGSPSASTLTFWNDATRVAASLADPPSAELLKQIREEPWRGGLEPVPSHGIPRHEAEVIEGKIPTDLKGMLCRNGPGRIRIGETQYGHWFDGDGLVTQLVIDGTKQTATFQARYVETERFLAQQSQVSQTTGQVPMAKGGAWTKRGKGSRWDNLFAIPTNPANTNVIFFPSSDPADNAQPLMYALAEGGDPVRMDCETLRTVGVEKITSKDGTMCSKSFFSAHYVKDPVTGDVYNHGLVLGAKPAVNVMKLDQYGNLIRQATTDLRQLGFIHDNALSESYIVLVVPPFFAKSSALLSSVLGGDPIGKKFKWNVENETETAAMIFSKETLECVASIPLPLLSSYHMIDCFESTDDGCGNQQALTIRVLVHDPPESRIEVEKCFSDLYRAGKLPLCKIMEYKVNVTQSTLLDSRMVAPESCPFELPDMNHCWGYKKRFVYTNTREDHASFANSLQKVDMETGKCSNVVSFGECVFAGAPLFVPRKEARSEDDGYVFAQLYRADDHKSDVCILDAKTMKKVTMLRLEHPVPYQFHGAWSPGSFAQT